MKSSRPIAFIAIFWLASAITIAVLAWHGPAGWDVDVYGAAIRSLGRGADPYAEGISAQQAFHRQQSKTPRSKPPMTYVYSPITLPVLRALKNVPAHALAAGYGVALLGGFILQLWSFGNMALPHERRVLPFIFPAIAFFPGLLNDDVLLSGNVVYLLYGLILAAAVPGWKRNRWGWYYVAVLAASCCKAPLLTLLVLSAFFGSKQWLKACATGVAGVLLFVCQSWFWPKLFAEYLTAVNLQFTFNDDFGLGPAGLLGSVLQHAGLSYSAASLVLYFFFAAVIVAVLGFTRRKIGSARQIQQMWLPVVLVGTILLNPRVKEYDVAILTVPLLLIVWRSFRALQTYFTDTYVSQHPFLISDAAETRAANNLNPCAAWNVFLTAMAGAGWFLAINFIAACGIWKPLELVILLFFFAIGTWASLYQARSEVHGENCREVNAIY